MTSELLDVQLKHNLSNGSIIRRSCFGMSAFASFFLFSLPRWKNCRPLSADGNYRPLSKARQQQNISMRRQENLRWMSELSYVEEKEQWQEQINQLKKQHEFSVSICQTLMQDQQVDLKSSYFAILTLSSPPPKSFQQ